jgi:hypothetical protein
MSDETYGFASQVGEWFGSVDIPPGEQRPMPAVMSVLGRLNPSLEKLHQPTHMSVSWGEYHGDGSEIAFHELEGFSVADWDAIPEQLFRLQASTPAAFGISSLFVRLDTRVIEQHGEVKKPSSTELQLSIDTPELQPSTIGLRYATFIDVWLSTTYDELYRPRDNRRLAAANRPRLEAVLHSIRSLVGSSFRVGQSQLYPFAITETGFRDADRLPTRTGGESFEHRPR